MGLALTEGTESGNSRYEQLVRTSLPMLLIAVILIAPLLEEFLFRGMLAKSNRLRRMSFILSIPIIGLMVYGNFGWGGTIAFILAAAACFAAIGRGLLDRDLTIAVAGSLFFGLVHYDQDAFQSWVDIFPLLMHISLGLILSWIVINYGLLRSVFVHMGYNFILIFLFCIPVLFPDRSVRVVKAEGHELTFSELTFVLNESGTISQGDDTISIKGLDLKKILVFTLEKKTFSDVLQNPFVRYDMEFRSKDGTTLTKADIQELLIKAEILEDTSPE